MRASESDRAIICPASLVQPRGLPRRSAADEAAGYGTLVHTWKEIGDGVLNMAGKWSDADRDLLHKKLLTSRPSRETLWPDERAHERTFAVSLVVPNVIWYTGSRDGADDWKKRFPVTEFVTGTADYLNTGLVGLHGNVEIEAWVDDLKTGRRDVSPHDNKQLLSYALAPWINHGCRPDYRVHTSITQWPKYPIDGVPVRHWGIATALDLALHLDDLRHAAAHPNETAITDACTFCDARAPHAATPWMQNYQHRAMPTCWKAACQHAQLEIT